MGHGKTASHAVSLSRGLGMARPCQECAQRRASSVRTLHAGWPGTPWEAHSNGRQDSQRARPARLAKVPPSQASMALLHDVVIGTKTFSVTGNVVHQLTRGQGMVMVGEAEAN